MRPLSRSISIVCAVFFILLCIVISFSTYHIFTKTLYDRYQKQLASIVTYIEGQIDHDDMAECARTYVESEKYKVFQAFFDDFIDRYEDVHYLYIMQVLPPEEPVSIREICAANSSYEKEYEPENVLHLGDGDADWFPKETEEGFRKILNGGVDVYYVNESYWGVDYTLARPLTNSAGERYGLLCADISIEELDAVVYRNIRIIIAVIAVSGIVFILMLISWMHRNVVRPIRLLQKSVTEYAGTTAGSRNPDELIFNPPDIRTKNEVRALADAVTVLSHDMRNYVQEIITAEDEAKDLQVHMSEMNTIAYMDALTKVKNKAAYDEMQETLNNDIQSGNAEFAIVMVDLNGLKRVNDSYGHEHGNEYLIGTCGQICEVFKHSPVFRVGGDEFVAVLKDSDYRNRNKLVEMLRNRYARSAQDAKQVPWHRYSAAVGVSEYRQGDTVEDVFNRADQQMYQLKAEYKASIE